MRKGIDYKMKEKLSLYGKTITILFCHMIQFPFNPCYFSFLKVMLRRRCLVPRIRISTLLYTLPTLLLSTIILVSHLQSGSPVSPDDAQLVSCHWKQYTY